MGLAVKASAGDVHSQQQAEAFVVASRYERNLSLIPGHCMEQLPASGKHV